MPRTQLWMAAKMKVIHAREEATRKVERRDERVGFLGDRLARDAVERALRINQAMEEQQPQEKLSKCMLDRSVRAIVVSLCCPASKSNGGSIRVARRAWLTVVDPGETARHPVPPA